MLSGHAHLGIYWQLNLNASQADLLMWPCPLVPPVFLPTSRNMASPILSAFKSMAQASSTQGTQLLLPTMHIQIVSKSYHSSKYIGSETTSHGLHRHSPSNSTFSLGEKATTNEPGVVFMSPSSRECRGHWSPCWSFHSQRHLCLWVCASAIPSFGKGMFYFLDLATCLSHLFPTTPLRLSLPWGLCYCLVCSLFYPQGAEYCLACNRCSEQI